MRRHFFNKRSAQGSVTIFLIIIMLPMLIFSCSIIDLCKIYMARNSTDGALELAMNSRLASYDDILNDMYGILASSANEAELSEKLATYYAMTLESSTGSKLSKDETKYVENFFSTIFNTGSNPPDLDGNGLLNLYEDSNAEFSVTPVATSSVSNPEVMHKQIVEYMKFRGPVYLTTGGLDLITAFTDVSNQAKAAKAQLDYEKTLSDAGSTFEEAYNNLNGLLNDAVYLEGDGKKPTAFAECYYGNPNHIMAPREYLSDLSQSVDAAFVCSFFGGAFKEDPNRKGEWILSYVAEAEEAFGSNKGDNDSSDPEADLSTALGALIGLEGRARDAEKIFSFQGLAGDFISSADSSAANYLNNDFGIIFDGVKSVKRRGGDVTDVITLFEAYNNARDYSDQLEKDIKDASDERKKLLEGEKSDLDILISNAAVVVEAVKDAAEAIKSFMERQFEASKEKYNSALAKLSAVHKTISDQYDRLEWLLSTKEGEGIDSIVSQMKNVAVKADTFRASIEGGNSIEPDKSFTGINTTSEKAAMQETYNSGAAEIVKIAGEITEDTKSISDLKTILGVLRDVYKAEKDSLDTLTYFGNELKNSYGSNKEFGLSACLKEYVELPENAGNVNNWYNFSKYKRSDFVSGGRSSGDNIGSWDSQNKAITDNDFYKVVVKYGKTNTAANEEASKKAGNIKESIDTMGKQAGDKSDNGYVNEDEVEKEEAGAKFIPANYPVYTTYLADLQDVWKVDHGGDAMLDMIDSADWFSVETSSDGKDTKIPGNYDTSEIGGEDDNGKIAEKAGDMLAAVGEFFVDLLEATRDKLYIAEYMTENFPCFTTLNENPDATMISGIKFKEGEKANVVCSKSSLEYILYGDMDKDSDKESGLSVAKASAVLFGVRFALNLIYALTSPTLAGQIEPIVAPLEAIPFAGPIARTVILIGLALGESAIDITLLLANQEVALFKNDLTWVCSPEGFLRKLGDTAGEAVKDNVLPQLINDAEQKATEAVTNAVLDAEDKLFIGLEKGVDQASEEIDEYVEEKLEAMRKSIENDVWSPIVSTIKAYIEDFKNTQIKPELNDIEERLKKIFASDSVTSINLGLTDADTENDELKKVENAIFMELLADKANLAQLIHENIDEFSETAQIALDNVTDEAIKSLDNGIKGVLEKVETTINTKFDEKREIIANKIKDGIKEFANEVKDETAEGINKVGDDVKKRLKAKLSAYTNDSAHGKKTGSSKVDLSKGSKDSGNKLLTDKADSPKQKDTSIKVSYKQYLYVFTVLGLIINEDKMLMRASQLMNASIELTIGSKTTRTEKPNAYNSNVPYNINKAYTLFRGEAGSKTRTMFLGTSWNRENQTWIRPASNVFRYKATTYVGY